VAATEETKDIVPCKGCARKCVQADDGRRAHSNGEHLRLCDRTPNHYYVGIDNDHRCVAALDRVAGPNEDIRYDTRDWRGQDHAAQALRCLIPEQLGRGQLRLSQIQQRRIGRTIQNLQRLLGAPKPESTEVRCDGAVKG